MCDDHGYPFIARLHNIILAPDSNFTFSSTCNYVQCPLYSFSTTLFSLYTFSSYIYSACASLSSVNYCFAIDFTITFVMNFPLKSTFPFPLPMIVIVLLYPIHGVWKHGGGRQQGSSGGRLQSSLASGVTSMVFNHFTSFLYILSNSVIRILRGAVGVMGCLLS